MWIICIKQSYSNWRCIGMHSWLLVLPSCRRKITLSSSGVNSLRSKIWIWPVILNPPCDRKSTYHHSRGIQQTLQGVSLSLHVDGIRVCIPSPTSSSIDWIPPRGVIIAIWLRWELGHFESDMRDCYFGKASGIGIMIDRPRWPCVYPICKRLYCQRTQRGLPPYLYHHYWLHDLNEFQYFPVGDWGLAMYADVTEQ